MARQGGLRFHADGETRQNSMSFPASFSLSDDYLAASATATNKSERTRLRILGETTALLQQVHFSQLVPGGLATHIGVSRTLIYHYFKDLPGLAAEIASDYGRSCVAGVRQLAVAQGRFGYADLVGYLSWIMAVDLRNRGPARLMLVPQEQLPGVAAASRRFVFELQKAVGDSVDAPTNFAYGARERLMTGFIIGGGFDSLLRELFVFPNEFLPQVRTTRELFELVQLVATFRHRSVHGKDPTRAETEAVRKAFDLSFFEPCLEALKSFNPGLAQVSVGAARKRRQNAA
jgi:AcrR family transcriptional regulator